MNSDTHQEQREETPAHLPAPASRRGWWVFLVVAVVVAASAYFYFGKKLSLAASEAQAAKVARKVPVVAVPATTADIPVYLTGLGSVTPLNTVTVKSRVDGQLLRVLFREGQTVSAGTLLAEIDSRPFVTQLAQVEGQMAKDQALLTNARVDLARYQQLAKQDSIARQQLDTQEALVRQYEGALKADKGAIDSAKLQVSYSRITAPITGRVGLRLVDAGNMVRASDTNGLVVITQMQPISVVFSIPEDSLPAVLEGMKKGTLGVDAYNREGTKNIAKGSLATIDNQIDPATGTVKLKAQFANGDGMLFPSQFVNAKLLLETRKDATIVPAAAVQRGQQGTFVFIVKPDRTVALRPVKVGTPDGDRVAIDAGVTVGEQVVVEGADKLRDGTAVEVQQPGGGDKAGRRSRV